VTSLRCASPRIIWKVLKMPVALASAKTWRPDIESGRHVFDTIPESLSRSRTATLHSVIGY